MAKEPQAVETTGTGPGSKPYPYNFEAYRSPEELMTLDALGEDTTFEELFNLDYRSILRRCRRRADIVRQRAIDYLGHASPPVDEYRKAIDAITACLSRPVTQRRLMEQPKGSWPARLEEKVAALFGLGCFVNFHLIPDEAKEEVVHFFSEEGDDFLGREGSLTLRDYYELPRSAYSQEVLDLFYKARRLGILACHPDALVAAGAKGGKCWNGTACVDTSLNLVCNGDTGSSDACP